ncbi:MAG: hypothetical protein ACJAZ4_000684 [Neptuniibacter pectenicola]|jgi:hypothetical protein|uniref:Arm DNA-binding domain-containing protein n=1 Tax=Neptuniibacter pectenicola TaxID=1806669 RepID=UPI000A4991A6
MLTDTKIRNLKPKEKLYKINDRDGLYVAVTTTGTKSFRCNYSINGRQETITFGRYAKLGSALQRQGSSLERLKSLSVMVSLPLKRKRVVKLE